MSTALPASGTISFSQVKTVFDGSANVPMSAMYQLIGQSQGTPFKFSSMYGQTAPSNIITFTNCGAYGNSGPTLAQVQSANAGLSLWQNIQGYQLFTVPSTGRYKLTVAGARGATPTVSGLTSPGGYGGLVVGRFNLKQNQQLVVSIGQYANVNNFNGSGGGATTVVVVENGNLTNPAFPLLVAGGGGGGTANTTTGELFPGGNANVTLYGTNPSNTSGLSFPYGAGYINNGVAGLANGAGGGWCTIFRSVGGGTNLTQYGGFGGGTIGSGAPGGAGGYSGGTNGVTANRGSGAGTNYINTQLSYGFVSNNAPDLYLAPVRGNGFVTLVQCV